MMLSSRKRQRTGLTMRTVLFAVMALMACRLWQSQNSASMMERNLLVMHQPTAIALDYADLTIVEPIVLANESHQVKDWFNRDHYTKASKKCFYVEDMCHGSNRWFYRNNDAKHQPSFVLEMFVSIIRDDAESFWSLQSSNSSCSSFLTPCAAVKAHTQATIRLLEYLLPNPRDGK
jgi:hypothetical protein